MEGLRNVLLVGFATDGRDGPTDAAGAAVDGTTIARARRAGFDPASHLRNNDAYPLLDATGDLIRTGPTGTNVADLALILCGPDHAGTAKSRSARKRAARGRSERRRERGAPS
jgi:glycerate-2-kinase